MVKQIFSRNKEKSKKQSPPKDKSFLKFDELIEMGEYRPEYLNKCQEWNSMSGYIQLQYIRKAVENRRRQLRVQWSEINNVLDFRLKPELKIVLSKLEKEMRSLDDDVEKLYLEYVKKI